MRSSRTLLVPVVTIALLLSACAGEPTPTASPSTTAVPSATATPEPVQLPETGLVAPAQVFGGSCEAVFTAEQLTTILGGAATASVQPTPIGNEYIEARDYFVEQAGGVRCQWGATGIRRAIGIVVVPSGSVGAFTSDTGCRQLDEDLISCFVNASANGMLLAGGVLGSLADEPALTVAAAAAVDLFAKNANAASAFPAPIPASTAWDNPTNCDAGFPEVDFATALGGPGPYIGGVGGGSGAYFTPLETALKSGTGVCDVYSETASVGFSFSALGGARWMETRVAAMPGATRVTVPGIETVITVAGPYGTSIHAFDGVNWLNARTYDVEAAYPAMTLLVAALNAR